jgi:hypothetical protein
VWTALLPYCVFQQQKSTKIKCQLLSFSPAENINLSGQLSFLPIVTLLCFSTAEKINNLSFSTTEKINKFSVWV